MSYYSSYWKQHYQDLTIDGVSAVWQDDERPIDTEWMSARELRFTSGGYMADDNIWVAPDGIVYYYQDLKRLNAPSSGDDAIGAGSTSGGSNGYSYNYGLPSGSGGNASGGGGNAPYGAPSGGSNGFPFSGFPNPFTSPFTGPVNNLLGGVADYSGAPGLASHPALASMNMLTNGFPLSGNSYTPATSRGQKNNTGDDSCYDILFDVVGPGPRYKGKLTFYDKKTGDEVASCEAISGCDSPVQYGTPYGSKFTITNFSSPSFGNTRIFGPGQVISFKVSLSPSKLTDPQTGNDAGPFFIFPMSDNSNCTKGAIGVKGDYKQLKNIQDLLKACAKCGASLRVGTPQENSGPTPPPPSTSANSVADTSTVTNTEKVTNPYPVIHHGFFNGETRNNALAKDFPDDTNKKLLQDDQVKRAIEQGKRVIVEYDVTINGEHVTKTDILSSGNGGGDFVIHVTGDNSMITIDIPGLNRPPVPAPVNPPPRPIPPLPPAKDNDHKLKKEDYDKKNKLTVDFFDLSNKIDTRGKDTVEYNKRTNEIVKTLKNNPTATLELHGNTQYFNPFNPSDTSYITTVEINGESVNISLNKFMMERAKTVKSNLVRKGANPNQILTVPGEVAYPEKNVIFYWRK